MTISEINKWLIPGDHAEIARLARVSRSSVHRTLNENDPYKNEGVLRWAKETAQARKNVRRKAYDEDFS